MSQHVSLEECGEIAQILREENVDARADGQEACVCCPDEVWSVVIGEFVFTDEDGGWWGIDTRTNNMIDLRLARASSAADVAPAIHRGAVVLTAARGASRS